MIFTNSFMSQAEISRHYSDKYTAFDYERRDEIHYAEYKLIPDKFTLAQYDTLLLKTPKYLDLFLNAVKLTLPAVFFQIIIGSLCAYGFTISHFRYKELLFCVYIIVMILPYQATLVPNYLIAEKMGLLNHHLSIILPAIFSPFAVFIMRQSMKSIPKDIFHAADMDGANHFHKFIYIALPLTKGGVASLFILSFTEYWSMVELPMILLRDADKAPLSLFLLKIGQDNMGLIFAASFFYMLPVIWIFLYGNEYFEEGVKLSALK